MVITRYFKGEDYSKEIEIDEVVVVPWLNIRYILQPIIGKKSLGDSQLTDRERV